MGSLNLPRVHNCAHQEINQCVATAVNRYPSVTQRVGTYRYGSCNIVNDGNGEDSSLVMQGSGMTCDVMEPGESGSGLWIRVNDQYYVRGVESHGLIREGQAELDVGCEFDTINYNFVLRNKDNKPRA